MKKIHDIINDYPVYLDSRNIVYESLEDKKALVVNELTRKAREEATMLASSFGRKIGKVISCSNVACYDQAYTMAQSNYEERFAEEARYDSDSAFPFNEQNFKFIVYVYRFELLN